MHFGNSQEKIYETADTYRNFNHYFDNHPILFDIAVELRENLKTFELQLNQLIKTDDRWLTEKLPNSTYTYTELLECISAIQDVASLAREEESLMLDFQLLTNQVEKLKQDMQRKPEVLYMQPVAELAEDNGLKFITGVVNGEFIGHVIGADQRSALLKYSNYSSVEIPFSKIAHGQVLPKVGDKIKVKFASGEIVKVIIAKS